MQITVCFGIFFFNSFDENSSKTWAEETNWWNNLMSRLIFYLLTFAENFHAEQIRKSVLLTSFKQSSFTYKKSKCSSFNIILLLRRQMLLFILACHWYLVILEMCLFISVQKRLRLHQFVNCNNPICILSCTPT
jgi:hypothetical protein